MWTFLYYYEHMKHEWEKTIYRSEVNSMLRFRNKIYELQKIWMRKYAWDIENYINMYGYSQRSIMNKYIVHETGTFSSHQFFFNVSDIF